MGTPRSSDFTKTPTGKEDGDVWTVRDNSVSVQDFFWTFLETRFLSSGRCASSGRLRVCDELCDSLGKLLRRRASQERLFFLFKMALEVIFGHHPNKRFHFSNRCDGYVDDFPRKRQRGVLQGSGFGNNLDEP